MIPLQNDRIIVMLAPQAVTADGTNTSGVVDMLDYGAVRVELSVASSTTTALPIAVAFQESDTTDATNFATIASAGTASTGWKTQVTNATAVSSVTASWMTWTQPWGANRKRYLRSLITGPTTGTFTACMLAIQSRPAITPTGTNVSGTYISTSVGSTYVLAAV